MARKLKTPNVVVCMIALFCLCHGEKEFVSTTATVSHFIEEAVLPLPPYLSKLTFPALEFFNVSQDGVFEFSFENRRFYIDNFLSRRMCPGENCRKTCSCKADCMKSRSCCIDYLWNQTKPIDLQQYLSMFLRLSQQYPQLDCKPVLDYFYNHEVQKVLMVATCPKSASNELHEKCALSGNSNDLNIPVLGSDDIIYRNQYCAICNSIAQFNYVNISVLCEGAENTSYPGKFFSNFKDCNITIVKPDGTVVQSCEHVYNRNCDRQHPFYDLCNAYVGETGKSPEYANVHCLWCNKQTFDIYDSFTCTEPSTTTKNRWYSFVISFTDGTDLAYRNDRDLVLNPDGTVSIKSTMSSVCPLGQTFDVAQGTCVPFKCGLGYQVSGSTCIRVSPYTALPLPLGNNSSFDACLIVRGAQLYFMQAGTSVFSKSLSELSQYLLSVLNGTTNLTMVGSSNSKFAGLSRPLSTAELGHVLSTFSKSDSQIWTFAEAVFVSAEKLSSVTDMYGPDFSRHVAGGMCADSVSFSESLVDFDGTCGVRLRRNLSASVGSKDLSYLVHLKPGIVSKQVVVCKAFHLLSSCPLFVIPTTNFSVINGTTSIFARNKTFKYSEYQPLAVGVGICINSTTAIVRHLPSWMKTTDKVEYYLTVIGIPVSMFCYVWIILTFTLIRELRNIPGYNLVALCSSLLLSDAIFLTIIQVKQSSSSCKGLAILFHWLLLLVQAWCGIIAFEIARKFGSTVPVSSVGTGRFAVYCGVSFALSTAVVVVMISVDEAEALVGYGKDHMCWIYSFYARLFGYILIVVLVTGFSIFLVAFVLVKIYKQHKVARDTLKDSKQNDINLLKIALKLVLLVGSVEIVGLVQIVSADSEWEHAVNATFRIFYTFLRSFRGVLIWIMYIATKMILKHYRSKASEWSSIMRETEVRKGKNLQASTSTELLAISSSSASSNSRNEYER